MHTNLEGLLLSNKQSKKTDRKMLYSKMLPSSDSGTERGASSASASFSSSLWVQLILSLRFNCHNCFMFATQPLLCLFVSPTRSRSPCFSEGSDASNEEGAGVRRGTTRNTGNGKFEWSYHLFWSRWSKPISCFALWSSGWDATMQRWAMWLM